MDPIDEFFAHYPKFPYNRHKSSPREFYRMCDWFHWDKDATGNYPSKRIKAHERFRKAMIECFNQAFGQDVNNSANWEMMCTLLEMDPIPKGIENMKKAVLETHLNLADLLDGQRSGGSSIRVFATQEELAEYTISEGRYFPKEDAYAGGVLRYLLREIHNAYLGRKGAGQKKSQHKKGKKKPAQQSNRSE